VVALLVATAAGHALSMAMFIRQGGSMNLLLSILEQRVDQLAMALGASVLAGLLTLATAIAWWVWFDRVLQNVPPLTGQWPDVGRFAAFGWWLVPIAGLIKAPRIVGDVYAKLSVPGTPGLWLLALWVLTWIGGTVGPWVLSRVLGFVPLDLEAALAVQDLVAYGGQALLVAAAFFAVALVMAIEHAQDVRVEGGGSGALPADLLPPPAPPVTVPNRFAQTLTPFADELRRPVDPDSLPLGSMTASSAGAADITWAGLDGGASETVDRPAIGTPLPADDLPVLTPVVLGPRVQASATTAPASRRAFGLLPPVGARPDPVAPAPLLAMVVFVVFGLVGGFAFAGAPIQRPSRGALELAAAGAMNRQLPTPPPLPTVQRTTAPVVRPTPTPEPADRRAARLLIETTFPEEYRGRTDLDLKMVISGRTFTMRGASVRAGDTEWSRLDSDIPGMVRTEQVLLDKHVWERRGGDWARRNRVYGDQPLQPLFNLHDLDQLVFLGTVEERGRRLYRYRWDGGTDKIGRALLAQVPGARIQRSNGSVLATADGVPVRTEVTYDAKSSAGKIKLLLTLSYSEVGTDFAIRSPLEGSPVVKRD
jgi:hypothetical protein